MRQLMLWTIGIVVIASTTMWLVNDRPTWMGGASSRTEVLRDIFRQPIGTVVQPARFALKRMNKIAVFKFLETLDLPDDVEYRVKKSIDDSAFDETFVPFVFYLYNIYSTPVTDGASVDDLAYAETNPGDSSNSGMDLGSILKESVKVRGHVRTSVLLFDALFIQDRSTDESYDTIKSIVRDITKDAFGADGDSSHGNEMVKAIETILSDDQQLENLIKFFTDFVRLVSDSWLEGFVRAELRADIRKAWFNDRLESDNADHIVDYIKERLGRRKAVHIVVDGLQGVLLEGLVNLGHSSEESFATRYLAKLSEELSAQDMQPSYWKSDMPAPAGADLSKLLRSPGEFPDYMSNFYSLVYSPEASSTIVSVASVDSPSISVRNLPIAYSGHRAAGPHGTGIPNFSYVDRRSKKGWYFWGSDILHIRKIFGNREDEIPGGVKRPGSGAKTLFERLWRYNTVSAMATIDTGAIEKVSSEIGVAIGELQRNFIEKVIIAKLRNRAAIEKQLIVKYRQLLTDLSSDQISTGQIKADLMEIAAIEDQGLPDYLLWYNPWPDHYAHGKGPYSDDIIGLKGEYDRLDFYLGKVVEVYQELEKVNPESKVLFGVVSDHGLVYTPKTISTEKAFFQKMKDDGINLTWQKITADEGALPAIRGNAGGVDIEDVDFVVGSTAGGSYVIDANPLADTNPDYNDLLSWRLKSGEVIDLISNVKEYFGEYIDFAMVKEKTIEGTQLPDGVVNSVRLFNRSGESRITRSEHNSVVRYRYEILQGDDPLGLSSSVRDYLLPESTTMETVFLDLKRCMESEDGCSGEEWSRILGATERVDSIVQLSHLYDSERAGTVNIFPAKYYGLNSGVPGRHAGEAFGEKNGTQVYFGSPVQAGRIHTARNGSLPVTLYHWLVGSEYEEVRQEFGFPSLAKQVLRGN